MRINGFHLEGFGLYHDQEVQGLPPGLILFVGDNESGKTTLMEFFRTVLFGFPRKGTRNDYPPLRGGRHGGRLVLEREDGRLVTVERFGRQAAIIEAGGLPQRGEPSQRLLAGLDRPTFEHIFAVGLDDLKGLEVLTGEGVRGRLFSAGAGLGAASVPAALKTIDSELGNLYAPRSKKRLNLLIDRLREIDKELRTLQGQAADYAECQRHKEELEERIHEERDETEEIRQRLRRLEQLEQAREPWVNLITARQQAAELEIVQSFPPNGLEQLGNLKTDLEKIHLSLGEWEEEATRVAQQLEHIVVDEGLVKQKDNIESLMGEREKFAGLLADLPGLRHAVAQAEEELRGRLRDLGADWDAARLAQVDTSVSVRQRVQEFGRSLDFTERRVEQLRTHMRFQEERLEEAGRNFEEASRRWQESPAPSLKDQTEVRQRQEAVRLLRTLLHRREMMAAQLEERRLRHQEAGARLAALRRQSELAYEPIPWWAGVPLAMLGFALAAVLSARGHSLTGHLIFLAGLCLAGLVYLLRHRLLKTEAGRMAQVREEERQVEDREKNLAADISHLAAQITSLHEEQEAAARRVDESLPQDLAHLEAIAARLDQAAEYLQQWLSLELEKEKAEKDRQEIQAHLEKAGQKTDEAEHELHKIEEEWHRWLAAHGFSDSLRPEGFEAVLQAVERAREAERKNEDHGLRLSDAEKYVNTARERIRLVLEASGRTAQDVLSGVEDLDTLRLALAEAQELQNRKNELQGKLEAAHRQLAQIERLRQDKEGEVAHLLTQADAATEEEFHRLASLYQEYRTCLAQIERSEITLLNIAGNPEAWATLETELLQTDSLSLHGEKDGLEARLRVLEESLPRADQEVGRITLKLSQMAQDEKLGDLLQEQSILEEQLEEATKRWTVLLISRHLVELARGVHERERQPQVIREADRFLGVMTGDRYRLVSSLGEESVQLEDRSFRRKDQIHWSDGLADQVYLAVRLGLAREFGRHAETLPVILDDVLVKFDPRRRRGAARVLLEFSRDQQVLLFTCHPEFERIISKLQQEDHFRTASVTSFHITEGFIQPFNQKGLS